MGTIIIYRTISFIRMLVTLFFRLLLLSLIGNLLYHFNENPVLILIIMAIALLFLLLSGTDYITLYADSFTYKSNALIKFFASKQTYQLADIKSVVAEGDYGVGDELASQQYRLKPKPLNKITIEFTDGTTHSFETSIYINELKKIMLEIDEALKKQRHNRK